MDYTQGVTAGVTIAVLSALAPLAMRTPEAHQGTTVLQLPKIMRLLVWFGMAFLAAVLAVGIWSLIAGSAAPKDERAMWLFGPFVLVLVVVAFREMRVHLELDEEGIRGRTAFRGQRAIAWRDVIAVSWSNSGYWFKLTDRQGETLRVSAWLQGHKLVVEKLRQHVQESAWDRAIQQWQRRVSN
jgi:hypothetical protein